MSRSYEKRVMFHVLRCPQQSWSWPSEKTDSHHAFLKLCAFYGFFTNSNQTPSWSRKISKMERFPDWKRDPTAGLSAVLWECQIAISTKAGISCLHRSKKSLSFLSQEPTFCQPDRVTVPLKGIESRGCTCTMCNRYLWNPLFIEFTSGNCTSCTASFKPLKSPYRASTRCS